MTRHDLSRVEAELRIALQLMNVATSSEDARMDAIFHVTAAHVLLTNPVATLVGGTSHTDRCLAPGTRGNQIQRTASAGIG